MSYHNTSLMDLQDCIIHRTILGFLTTPLFLLIVAGTIIAL